MNYSKAFRIVRAAFGLSQAELSHLLGVGSSQVSLIEAGKRQPSHKVVRQLAEGLRIPPSLIALLASEPKDLEEQEGLALEPLAVSLLKLLVSATEQKPQRVLPFSAKEVENA